MAMNTFKHPAQSGASESYQYDTPKAGESILAPLRSRTGMLWLISSGLSCVMGAWLLIANHVFGIASEAPAARSDQVVGALILLTTAISLGKRTRPARIGNVALAGWLVIAPWFLSGGSTAARWNSTFVGFVILALSMFLGKRRGM
jgi:hypothetical protein